MRIGVNCYSLRADIGGLKQYFFHLFDWLLQHDHENEYVFLYVQENLGELEKLASPRWRRGAILLEEQDQIGNYFGQLDLYFCPFGALRVQPAPLPSVVTLVDIQEVFFPEFFTPNDLYQRAYYFRASARAADRVITISEYSKQTIARHYGVSKRRIVVAHLCANALFFDEEQAAAPSAPFDDFLIYPANWWRHKNHDLLLRAMVQLRDSGMIVNAVLTGFEMESGYPVTEKIREYGLERQVHVTGYVSDEQLSSLYQRARMMVFPSLFEGFGMPLVEAMAAGCPVVASLAACIPEVAGDAAVYFDPHKPEELARVIRNLWHDDARRQQMTLQGQARARQFSPERLARQHLRAFQEARSSWSVVRHQWQLHVYQPLHRKKVERWLKRQQSPG